MVKGSKTREYEIAAIFSLTCESVFDLEAMILQNLADVVPELLPETLAELLAEALWRAAVEKCPEV